jgi:cell division protease FtsH
LLDSALLRPGRFDRRIALDMPDKDGRKAILAIHAKGKKFSRGINWDRVSDRTVGFSGADLENMLNEAAILAAREGRTSILFSDIEESATKVKLGPAKRKLQSDEDRQITAFHEAGHAVVSHFLSKTDPVQRVSIVARGMSLGHTEIAPTSDRSHETKTRILQQITALMGGRVAEEIVFGEMTAGAASDIKVATRYARAMVVELGMSSLGPVNFGVDAQYVDFGKVSSFEDNSVSPETLREIDKEVGGIIGGARREAEKIIKKNRKKLEEVAGTLLTKETLNRVEFEKIVGKKIESKGGEKRS